MMNLADSVRADRFLPLPKPVTDEGQERLTGIEIEFGGLDEDRVAEVVRACLGGHIENSAHNAMTIADTRIGTVEILLDTRFRKSDPGALRAALLDLAKVVVPVELVTAPLGFDALPWADRLRSDLRDAGATGTGQGAFLGFGMHLNTQVPALDAEAIGPVLRAFALLEAWLREDDPIDTTRRILPFVEPYPTAFVDALARGDGLHGDLGRLIDTYLDHAPSRNHGLDLLPLFRHIDAERVTTALGQDAAAVSARPTWHYRLPDCRIDEAGWSLALEWNRWRVVECVADDPALSDRLADDWQHGGREQTAAEWASYLDKVLADTPDRWADT